MVIAKELLRSGAKFKVPLDLLTHGLRLIYQLSRTVVPLSRELLTEQPQERRTARLQLAQHMLTRARTGRTLYWENCIAALLLMHTEQVGEREQAAADLKELLTDDNRRQMRLAINLFLTLLMHAPDLLQRFIANPPFQCEYLSHRQTNKTTRNPQWVRAVLEALIDKEGINRARRVRKVWERVINGESNPYNSDDDDAAAADSDDDDNDAADSDDDEAVAFTPAEWRREQTRSASAPQSPAKQRPRKRSEPSTPPRTSAPRRVQPSPEVSIRTPVPPQLQVKFDVVKQLLHDLLPQWTVRFDNQRSERLLVQADFVQDERAVWVTARFLLHRSDDKLRQWVTHHAAHSVVSPLHDEAWGVVVSEFDGKPEDMPDCGTQYWRDFKQWARPVPEEEEGERDEKQAEEEVDVEMQTTPAPDAGKEERVVSDAEVTVQVSTMKDVERLVRSLNTASDELLRKAFALLANRLREREAGGVRSGAEDNAAAAEDQDGGVEGEAAEGEAAEGEDGRDEAAEGEDGGDAAVEDAAAEDVAAEGKAVEGQDGEDEPAAVEDAVVGGRDEAADEASPSPMAIDPPNTTAAHAATPPRRQSRNTRVLKEAWNSRKRRGTVDSNGLPLPPDKDEFKRLASRANMELAKTERWWRRRVKKKAASSPASMPLRTLGPLTVSSDEDYVERQPR